MKSLLSVRFAAIIVSLLAAIVSVSPALGAPDYQDNLLANAGFEAGSLSSWQTWYITSTGDTGGALCGTLTQPTFDASASGVRSGSYAAHYANQWSSHNAGLYQVVTNVTPGETYRFTIWGRAISRNENESASSSYTKMRIGIDPTGGTDASSTAIVWSADATPMDTYVQFSVQVKAVGDKITVYTRSRPDWCMDINEVYWDDASLTLAGAAAQATPAPQQTTQPSQNTQTSTPDATGRVVHTVQAGDTLSGIAFLYGVTVDEIRQLNNMTSDVVVLGTRLVIKSGSEAATPEPTTEATEQPAEGETPAEEEVTETPPPEPTEEPTVVAELPEAAGTGTICVMSYEDANNNGIRDAEEAKLAGITFVLNDGTEMVGRYTTDGVSEPYCFTDLVPGAYVVSWAGDSFTATTDQTWAINVDAGSILSHEFGAQPLGQEAGEETGGGAASKLPSWAIALIAAVGVIVVMAGIGALGYFIVVRRQQI